MTKKEERARRLILRANKLQAQGKAYYQKADDLISVACPLVGSGSQVRLSDTEVAYITDQFEEKDILWGHGAVRRWKIDIKAAGLKV